MAARLLDGKQIAAQRKLLLQKKLQQWHLSGGRSPGLAVILVGNDPASLIYTERKCACCKELGFVSRYHHLPDSVDIAEVIALIKQLNVDDTIDGILIQLPLPADWCLEAVLEAIDPTKDVDGFYPSNLGRLVWGWPSMMACTPLGIMHMLAVTQVNLVGINAVLVGASSIVGKPLALELLRQGATVTVAHESTKNLAELVAQAELLVVAAGVKGLISGHWIKLDSIVIDVGINRDADGKIYGDVEFAEAAKRAAWITPVPGGVGPMTVQCLMENSWLACQNREKRRKIDNI